ncbi:MAG: hypothetical protein NTV00_15880 [Methylococcales bacterium]|nr:hypothetical protein [Methylococcales bacterium]
MYKVIFSSLIVFGAVAHADNTPTFDFNTGVLSMPFVSTSQGIFNATLQIDPNLPATTFAIKQANPTGIGSDTTTPPTFDFNTGLLTLPKVNSSAGTYTATLQFADNFFKLTMVQPVAAPQQKSSNTIGGCSVFPANNAWNTRIDTLPLHSRSAAWVNVINTAGIRTDFGADFGQPYNIVLGSQVPKYTFNFTIPSESDLTPYPIPDDFRRENTSDNRLFVIDSETCKLYEAYNAQKSNGQWTARRGAAFDLNSNQLRPQGWGSADEAGLPTVPGLVRYEELLTGEIKHALRFTMPSPNGSIWPARHASASGGANNVMPMGARLRLSANFDISAYEPELRVILQAMKTYGILLADPGSALFLSGTPDARWNDDVLAKLRTIKGSNFEVVNSECMMVNPDSGEADPNKCN